MSVHDLLPCLKGYDYYIFWMEFKNIKPAG